MIYLARKDYIGNSTVVSANKTVLHKRSKQAEMILNEANTQYLLRLKVMR